MGLELEGFCYWRVLPVVVHPGIPGRTRFNGCRENETALVHRARGRFAPIEVDLDRVEADLEHFQSFVVVLPEIVLEARIEQAYLGVTAGQDSRSIQYRVDEDCREIRRHVPEAGLCGSAHEYLVLR